MNLSETPCFRNYALSVHEKPLLPSTEYRTGPEPEDAAMLLYNSGMRWAEGRSSRFFGTDPMFCDRPARLVFSPLRTDAVNRGFCISLLTLEIVVLAVSIGFLPFFIPPKILAWIAHKICSQRLTTWIRFSHLLGLVQRAAPVSSQTSTFSSVAVLQTFTEIVNGACERGDVVPPASQDFHSRVKFSCFLQNCRRRH